MRAIAGLCALALAVACVAGDDGGSGDTSAAGSTGSETPDGNAYAACDDPEHGCPADDCRERVDDGATWAVCVPACTEPADCPPVDGGNASPMCDASGRCALQCNPMAAVCPTGTTCIDGDPPQCMWPVDLPMPASVSELCAVVCDECSAAMILGWTDDCPTACEAELSDCDDAQLDEAYACPGGLSCPVGALSVRSCLQALACFA